MLKRGALKIHLSITKKGLKPQKYEIHRRIEA